MNQQIVVQHKDAVIVCGQETVVIKDAPPFPDLTGILSQAVPKCGANFDAKFFYGTDKSYDVFSRSNGWFSLSQTYMVLLTRQLTGGDPYHYSLAIYKTTPTFDRVYDDDWGILPTYKGQPGDAISFEDINKDGKTDLRICLPVGGVANCRTYFAEPETNTFVRWINAQRDENSSYAVEDKTIYFNRVAMPDVDLGSFVILNSKYAKDKNRVYSSGEPLPGFDPTTFKILDDLSRYIADKDHAYYDGEEIIDSDPVTLTYIYERYSKDRTHVFMEAQLIKGADPDSFQVLETPGGSFEWARDKNSVYYNGIALDNSVPEYFHPIDSTFGYDNLNVFYGIRAINGSDLNTFTVIKSSYPIYAKDKNQVYFGGAVNANPIIQGADPVTFEVVGDNYSKDKLHVFYKLSATPADPKTITYLGDANGAQYAADEKFVYRDGEIVPGANPNTFSLYR